MNGIKFDNTHSYNDLNLILSTVVIPPAMPRILLVDIPGGDGSVDLTESLGEVKFQDRECKFTFTVLPTDNFEQKKTEISNFLNGRRCNIVVDKDPDYYWTGRCYVDEYASNKKINKIVVGAVVAPYKLKKQETIVIVPAGDSVTVALSNGRRKVVPTITNTAAATIVFGNAEYNLSAGTHKLLNIELVQGDNIVTVTSTEDVRFAYQEGDL